MIFDVIYIQCIIYIHICNICMIFDVMYTYVIYIYRNTYTLSSLVAQMVKSLSAVWET